MIVAAGGDHGRCAVVLDAVRILVDTLVQLRGSTQSEGPEKCRANANRKERASVIGWTRETAHCAASLWPWRVSRKIFLQIRHKTVAASLCEAHTRRPGAALQKIDCPSFGKRLFWPFIIARAMHSNP
jgi:hypothetical protein